MKSSDTETEPPARLVIVAPPHSKFSYYLLMRECGRISGKDDGFDFEGTSCLKLKTALNAIKPDGNLPADFPLLSSLSLEHVVIYKIKIQCRRLCCRHRDQRLLVSVPHFPEETLADLRDVLSSHSSGSYYDIRTGEGRTSLQI